MGISLEHDAGLVAVGSFMSRLREEEIVKTREGVRGGIVVIDVVGVKRTYDAAQWAQAVRKLEKGRGGRGKFVAQEVQEAGRQNAGQKRVAQRRAKKARRQEGDEQGESGD